MSAEFDLKKWIGGMCESGFSMATAVSLTYNKGREQMAKEILDALQESYMEILTLESLAPTHFKKVENEKNIAFHYCCGCGDMSRAVRNIITKLRESEK